MTYLLYILTVFCIYAALTASLNLLVGYTGLLSLTHAGFAGIGAYGLAIATTKGGLGWLAGVAIGIAAAAVVAFALGVITLRVRDVYYIVGSFALQIIVLNVFLNWQGLTSGALGIANIRKPGVGSAAITSSAGFLVFTAAILLVQLAVMWRIVTSAYGRALRAIREDEIAAGVLGTHVARKKIEIFVVSSSMAAVNGALLASLLTFIHPASFDVNVSILFLSMVVVGGSANLWGSLLGAALLVGLPELLAFTDFGGSSEAQVRQILYAGALILCLRWRPEGLLPEGLTLSRLRRPARRSDRDHAAELT